MPAPHPTAPALDRALDLVRFLRANCPWDAEQTPSSLIRHLLEEAAEVADAIRDGDSTELEGELGDLLLNLAFQVVIGEELGHFDADSVAKRLEDKMRRRHPHLYGLGEAEDWEVLKNRERPPQSGLLDGLPTGLDPLHRAHRIQERVSSVGFDWEDAAPALEKVAEELAEVRAAGLDSEERVAEEVGDLLFAVVNFARLSGLHAATCLDRANRKFRRRFGALERRALEAKLNLAEASLEEMDALWDQIKSEE